MHISSQCKADGFKFLAYKSNFISQFYLWDSFFKRENWRVALSWTLIKRFQSPLIAIFNLFVPIDFVFFKRDVVVGNRNNEITEVANLKTMPSFRWFQPWWPNTGSEAVNYFLWKMISTTRTPNRTQTEVLSFLCRNFGFVTFLGLSSSFDISRIFFSQNFVFISMLSEMYFQIIIRLVESTLFVSK